MKASVANKTPHLEFRDVYCSPPARPALRGTNLVVSRGTFLALTGANGSGKGTFCRCLARVYKEYHGQIVLDGKSLPSQTQDLAAVGIMIVLQGPKVFAEMSVIENLLSAPATWCIPEKEKRLDATIQLLPHLKTRFHQIAGTLSGGEQQLVAIGRALMAEPSLIVLEEPSLGLSTQATADVYAALKRISTEGRTVIVTEETVASVSRYADEIHIMNQGQITNVVNTAPAREKATFI